jgi:hypothetical protein
MRWMVLTVVVGLGLLGMGVYFLFSGDVVWGTIGVLTGLLVGGGSVIFFGQRRGDPRAGGKLSRNLLLTEQPLRGPYLVVAELIMGLGAVTGLLYIIFTPVGGRLFTDTAVGSRIFGFVLVGGFVIGAVWQFVRSRRSRQQVRR